MTRFALIGYPLVGSGSPALFYRAYNGKWSYELVDEPDFELAWERFLKDYKAINISAPFSKGYYYLPAMGGSFSIKSVLPSLFPNDPELDYHALDDMCQNGGDAMTLFPKLQDMSPEDEEKARRALLNYDFW
jgi:hypothetical protein